MFGPEVMEFIASFWGVGVGIISFVVWIVRLEAKMALSDKEIAAINKRRQEDLLSAKESRDVTTKRLDEILIDVRETNRDIKDLLIRQSMQGTNNEE